MLLLVVALALLLAFLLVDAGASLAPLDPALEVVLDGREPFPGPDPHPIPGRIEAEDYDDGGQGIAYYDTTPGNQGGAYRDDDVDIEASADRGGGYHVTWIEAGEWLSYSVYISDSASYDIQVRVASPADRVVTDTLPILGIVTWTVPLTRTLHVELDGFDVTGPLTFVATGHELAWSSLFARRVWLPAGPHTMRIRMDTGGFNLDWIAFTAALPSDPVDWLVGQMTETEKIGQLHGSSLYQTAANSRLGVPGFRMADGPHGLRGGPATAFPVGIALAASWDPDLVERIGTSMGQEFRAWGKNQAFAPCLDITRDPRNGRSPESGGEEPFLAGKIGSALARGLQSTSVVATAKHLAATNHQLGRKGAHHVIDARTLREFYGLPFRMAVQEGGVWSVMNAYNWINGRFSSANSELLTTVLRDEWGFDYYLASDWGSLYTSASAALSAGCDLELSHLAAKYPNELPGAVASGTVTAETLDRAVARVLRTKLEAGLFDQSSAGDPLQICSPEHRALALEAAQESIILLKNEEGLLPLDRTQPLTIALVGPSADVARLDGTGSSVVQPCYAYTPRQGIQYRSTGFPVTVLYARGCDINSEDTTGFPDALAAAAQADVVVFVGGLDATQEGEGRDRASGSVQLPGRQPELIAALAQVNPELVVVLESGGILALDGSLDAIKALLYAFYPGMEGGIAIADVLFGDVNPGGKLPVTMPRRDDQLPAWDDLDFSHDLVAGFGYRRFDDLGWSPQFAFGHGLSYSSFQVDRLAVFPAVTTADTLIQASVVVTNSGDRAGDEVVQLYVSADLTDPGAAGAVPMPAKQLRGFRRISLDPGQAKDVTFTLGPEELSFWSVSDNSFRIEAGTYTVRVGSSSDNLPLARTFVLTSSVLYDSVSGEMSPAHSPVLTNAALGRHVVCSSAIGPGYLCRHATDGDLGTRWNSTRARIQGICVDLATPIDLGRVVLHWHTAHGRAYALQASEAAGACSAIDSRLEGSRFWLDRHAGTAWTTLYATTSGDGEVDNLELSGRARSLRMVALRPATAWGYSLWEMEVYGVPLVRSLLGSAP